jgi:hypothetical protein
MLEAPGQVSRALRAAPPDRVVEAADQALRASLGASRTDVFIADYRISGLWPVLDPELPDGGFLACRSMAQRCFSSQQPVTDGDDAGRCRLYLPLSVWGERLGVLLVELPAAPGPDMVDRAADIAGDLAVVLRAADRETDRYRRVRRRERLSMAGAQRQPRRVRAGRPARAGVHGGRGPLRLVRGR